jgi:hypothetical protein
MKATMKATLITTTKATQGMLITIDGYSVFQNPKNYESNNESNDEKVTKPIREQRQPNNINKNGLKNGQEYKKVNSKDIPSRNKKNAYPEDSDYYKMAVYFHNKIMDHAAANKKEHLVKDAQLQKWADEFRKIVELDKRDKMELKKVIDWCTVDSFWKLNILSPKTLRKQYTQLAIKMDAKPSTPNQQTAKQKKNQEEMDLLDQFFKEAEERERNGDGQIFGSDKNSLS